MINCPPARLGDRLEDVDTPALLVDLDLLEANIAKMASWAQDAGVRLRPHAKTHKCSAIARMQIAAGAIGVCVQKVGEAEALAEGGVSDILVSNEVVGARKLDRLAALSKRIRVAVCADDAGNVDDLNAAAARFDTNLRVLVEIDVGGARCGVAPGEEALALARHIAAQPHLTFAGLQAYHGNAQHIRSAAERRAAIAASGEAVKATLALLDAAGLDCEIIGGGGTGTFVNEGTSGLWNELQVGSYVFMDRDYGLNLGEDGANVSDFAHALTILTSVMSAPVADRIVTDAGLKAYSMDSGLPGLADPSIGTVTGPSDEHTTIAVAPGKGPKLGDKIELIPGHCDPTVNLHDWIVAVRGGKVEAIWPVDARGALF